MIEQATLFDIKFWISIVMSFWLAWYGLKNLRFMWINYSNRQLIKKAAVLGPTTKRGDYVRFEGVLKVPPSQTPFSKKQCCYWSMVVRAEFQTKKPKPAKGMQTHKPVIYRDDLVDMPMMMIDNGLLVHAAFEDNTAVVVGLQTCDNTQTKCPELAKAHAKSKYKKYHIHECWLPVDAKVTLLGTVVSINENCVTLSGSALKSQPSILFNGVQSALKRRFLRHMKYALIPLSWATLSAVSMWTWLPWSMEFPLMIVACIGIYFVARKFHHIKPEF